MDSRTRCWDSPGRGGATSGDPAQQQEWEAPGPGTGGAWGDREAAAEMSVWGRVTKGARVPDR